VANVKLIAAVTVVALTHLSVSAAEEDVAAEKGVTAKISIKAPLAKVWEVCGDSKNFDSKIQSSTADGAIVEQRFGHIPILGETTATVKATTVPMQRLEYRMIRSDRLKALSGTWILTPINANSTNLQISSYVDPGLPVPRFLINRFVLGKVRSRLQKIKRLAESSTSN
jgi:hypothetical protein